MKVYTHSVSTKGSLGIPGNGKGIFGVRPLNWSLRFKGGWSNDKVKKIFYAKETACMKNPEAGHSGRHLGPHRSPVGTRERKGTDTG